jgi:hypothetical protein
MNLTDLPKWEKLSKKDRERLKKVFAPRIKAKYNLDGSKSASKKELEK